MRKSGEQWILLGLAILLHLTFKTGLSSDIAETPKSSTTLSTWTLDRQKLVGDTLIHLSFDPYFKTSKRYRAFPLKPNLAPLLKAFNNTDKLQLIFECTDGYRPHMPLKQVLAANAYLAYSDVQVPKGQHWPDSVAQKMAPFYLVWPEEDHKDKSFVTPYGLVKIEIKASEEVFTPALPRLDKHLEGYELFSNTCMRCHSVNKVGGTMAPELNFPKNITEYWSKENIWQFIQSPASFRYNSKMPAMKTIDREAFEKIYGYLQSMKDNKIQE